MFKHIRTKFLFIIIPVVMLSMMSTYLFSVNTGKNIIGTDTKERVNAEQEAQTQRIEEKLKLASGIAVETAAMVSQTYTLKNLNMYENTLQAIVLDQPMVLGAGIWFEPYNFDANKKYVGPYVYKEGEKPIVTYRYEGDAYNYFARDYYRLPRESSETTFTDVYYDEGLGRYLITCSSPIYDEKRKYIGCVSIDIELSYIEQFINEYVDSHNSNIYILNREGIYLAHSSKEFPIYEINIKDTDNASLQEAANTILRNIKGITSYQKDNKTVYLYFDTMDIRNWKIVYELPKEVMNAPLKKFSNVFLAIGVISSLIIGLLIYFVTTKNISEPLQILEHEIIKLGEQRNYNIEPIHMAVRKDEFGRIGTAFSSMKKQLAQYEQALNESMEEMVASNEEIRQQNELLVKQENQLIEKTKYNSAIIAAIPDMVFVFSEDGHFLECQGNTENLYMPKEAFIGRYIHEILPESIAIEGLQKIQKAIRTGEMQVFEYELANEEVSGYFELRIVGCYDDKAVGIVRNITEEHNQIEEIEYMSFHDQLTGLFNRRYYEFVLQEITNNRWKYPISVIFSDVNGLKLVNDSFGHEVGDLLLKKYSDILHRSKTKDEVIARIGGDEFAIFLPGKGEEEAIEYVSLLNQSCKMEKINGLVLSVSFGNGTIVSEEQSIQKTINFAEDMMYKNKMFEADSRHSRMIDIILQTLQEKNPREEKHSYRVAEICEKIATKLGKEDTEVQKIKNAALLHDIGKIGISEDILNKEGLLSSDEFKVICKHSEIGYRILHASAYMADVSDIVLHHHERWDGTGYPYGLKGEEIPIESRIITIADAFDAMISERTYRKALTVEEAKEELVRYAGIQFDPNLVNLFLREVMA